ncbi:MAG: alpha/beta hydrolase [Oscillospiraceae bacterium]
MKKLLKIAAVVLAVIAALALLLILLLSWMSKQPAVAANYYAEVTAAAPLEQKYTQKGAFGVSTWEQDAEDEKLGKFTIWYPTPMETAGGTYPAVVMANGTGVPASKYSAVFDHLASWGFIVIGNEDEGSWDGASSAACLDLLLRLNGDSGSVFFGKIDTDSIGVAGHSQGGVGAINAVTAQENGGVYKAVYTASTTHIALAQLLGWPYDVSRVGVPYFMTAGTKQADAGNEKDAGIAPLSSLQENYGAVSDDVVKVLARRADADHGDMLAMADGYMTAWFLYWLQGEEEAGTVFFGAEAEILRNDNWQDVQKNR